jgi:hypothetical protein
MSPTLRRPGQDLPRRRRKWQRRPRRRTRDRLARTRRVRDRPRGERLPQRQGNLRRTRGGARSQTCASRPGRRSTASWSRRTGPTATANACPQSRPEHACPGRARPLAIHSVPGQPVWERERAPAARSRQDASAPRRAGPRGRRRWPPAPGSWRRACAEYASHGRRRSEG